MHNAIGVGDTNLISVRTEKRENLQTEQPLTGLGQSDIYLWAIELQWYCHKVLHKMKELVRTDLRVARANRIVWMELE